MATNSSKKKTSESSGKKPRSASAKSGGTRPRPATRAAKATPKAVAAKPIKIDYLVEKLEEAHPSLAELPPTIDNLEVLILAHLARQMPLAEATKAFLDLKSQFVDWNEVRISTAGEVQELLRGAAEPLELAISLKDFLQRLFLDHHHVGLEFLRSKSNPELKNFFKKHPTFAESTSGLILERINDYPVVPLEPFAQPFLERVGLGPPGTTPLSRQKELHEKIPRERVLHVALLIHEHARATCPPEESEIDCPGCALKRGCPYPAKATRRKKESARRNSGK